MLEEENVSLNDLEPAPPDIMYVLFHFAFLLIPSLWNIIKKV